MKIPKNLFTALMIFSIIVLCIVLFSRNLSEGVLFVPTYSTPPIKTPYGLLRYGRSPCSVLCKLSNRKFIQPDKGRWKRPSCRFSPCMRACENAGLLREGRLDLATMRHISGEFQDKNRPLTREFCK